MLSVPLSRSSFVSCPSFRLHCTGPGPDLSCTTRVELVGRLWWSALSGRFGVWVWGTKQGG